MSEFYKVKKESITLIADSIRAKTGDPNDLVFPDEFVTAINTISGESGDEAGIPTFGYTGTYTLVDDGDNNWRIKFLDSGTFTVENNVSVDVFCVGGGGSGSGHTSDTVKAGGGGGGYTTTARNIYLEKGKEYSITIGAGGAATTGNGTGIAGGNTIFGNNLVVANGGSGGKDHGNGGGDGGSGGACKGGTTGGRDGSDGTPLTNQYRGKGQGTTTREFEETDGTLYSSGGDSYAYKSQILTGGNNTGDGGGGGGFYNGGGGGGSGIVVIRNARG